MSDLIERETVLAFVRRCKDRLQGKGLTYDILVDYIESIPSAERKGEWIAQHESVHGFWVGVCSLCGKEKRVDNYCPNCGADMRGENDV